MAVRVIQGDVREVLPTIDADSFDCIVTSPPYYGLRDYGCDAQIGLEPTLDEYLETIVAVCRELRRVLKTSGVFFLNIGDSYCSTDKWGGGKSGNAGKHTISSDESVPSWAVRAKKEKQHGIKPKDLSLVPERLGIALQADGWWVRSRIVWSKPNPMPESVTDRPTSAHETVWMLTKSARYFWDAEAVAEKCDLEYLKSRWGGSLERTKGNGDTISRSLPTGKAQALGIGTNGTRNLRNVWTITSQPFPGAHFATFPPELVERCIKAGSLRNGHVLDPFAGSGTVGLVADRLGRDATLIDLNTSYIDMAVNRIRDDAPLFAEIAEE